MSAATGGGGGGAAVICGTDLESHMPISSLSAALQGGLLLPGEEDGIDRLSAAMLEQGYCPIVVDDNIQAQSIRAHFKALKQQGKDWSHLPAQRQAEDAASSLPLYHGYLAAPDKRKEVVDVRVMQGDEEDALLCRLPTGPTAFGAMERVARLVLQIVSKGSGLKLHCLEDDLLDAYPLKRGQWSSSMLSSIHYQAPQQDEQAGVERVMAPSHVDRGVLTLVYSDTPGLQVRQGANGWVELPCGTDTQRGSLVLWVLAGKTLERATGGAIRAVEHRVVSHTGSDRHSVALKLRGHPSSLLHPGLLAQHMTVPMPLLHDFRKPITVREFEAGFEASHRSITYADQPQPQPQQQQEGRRATRSASRAMQGGGGGESRGVKRERGDTSEDDDTADMAIKQEERSEASRARARRGAASEGGGQAAGGNTRGSGATGGGGAADLRNDQPEATGDVGDAIRLVFRDADRVRADVILRVKLSTRFEKLMKVYADFVGIYVGTLRFFIDGNRCPFYATPATLQLNDGDEILVIPEQAGD